MSASESTASPQFDQRFWERLDRVETRHKQVQIRHENVRRGFERFKESDDPELQSAWRNYCEVIAELDRTTAEMEALRIGPA